MNKTTVALLFGGQSNEYEISCRSAATILSALREAGYRVLPIGITRRGDFHLFRGAHERLADATWEESSACTPVWFLPRGGMMTADGRQHRVDVVFPTVHGQSGEDGRLQGFLDTVGIPYVGCGMNASMYAWDKVLAKACARRIGIPTLPWVETAREGAEDVILAALSFPVFIKPTLSGSSVGAGRADDRDSLTAAVDAAAAIDTRILAEPCFTGREIEVAVLDDGETTVSRPGEIATAGGFYDYDTKYHRGTARLAVPANIPPETEACARRYALALFRALGCRHLARVDFFSDGEALYFNEINTLPGFTSGSMYPRLMENSGIPLVSLVSRLIEAAR